jgi:hypothetical protein
MRRQGRKRSTGCASADALPDFKDMNRPMRADRQPQVFQIAARELARLYRDLRCDGCEVSPDPASDAIWAKAGCGYYCPDCLRRGVHHFHPARSRR